MQLFLLSLLKVYSSTSPLSHTLNVRIQNNSPHWTFVKVKVTQVMSDSV